MVVVVVKTKNRVYCSGPNLDLMLLHAYLTHKDVTKEMYATVMWEWGISNWDVGLVNYFRKQEHEYLTQKDIGI